MKLCQCEPLYTDFTTDWRSELEHRNELRDELLAVTAARQELSPNEERYLVESFLDRLDREMDARVDARIEARLSTSRQTRRALEPWVIPASLGAAIPIVAIAGGIAGPPGVLLALVFVVILVIVYAEYSQR